MKWEKYNQLGTQDKEEYNFRFDKYHKFIMPINLLNLVTFYSLFSISMVIWYLAYMQPELKLTMDLQTVLFTRISSLISIIIIIEITAWIVITLYGFIKEYNWLKSKGV
jgi:ABC-type multidrug transport system permease subunit